MESAWDSYRYSRFVLYCLGCLVYKAGLLVVQRSIHSRTATAGVASGGMALFCSYSFYEVVKFYFHKIDLQKSVRIFLYLLVLVFFVLALFSFGKWYTFINLSSNIVFLIFVLNVPSFQKHLTHFLIAFLVACVPMFIVNGLLTALPVVEYNGNVFSNIRLFDIPIEDFSYFLLLMLMNVFVYEKSKQLIASKKSS